MAALFAALLALRARPALGARANGSGSDGAERAAANCSLADAPGGAVPTVDVSPFVDPEHYDDAARAACGRAWDAAMRDVGAHPRRGFSARPPSRGGAAVGGGSRPRRGCHADIPRGRVDMATGVG